MKLIFNHHAKFAKLIILCKMDSAIETNQPKVIINLNLKMDQIKITHK